MFSDSKSSVQMPELYIPLTKPSTFRPSVDKIIDRMILAEDKNLFLEKPRKLISQSIFTSIRRKEKKTNCKMKQIIDSGAKR